MGKQTFDRIKKTIAVLIAVLFVVSLAAASASARDGWDRGGGWDRGDGWDHGGRHGGGWDHGGWHGGWHGCGWWNNWCHWGHGWRGHSW